MAVIFIFVDGIGCGSAKSDNPLYTKSYDFVDDLTDGAGLFSDSREVFKETHLYKGIDANLGVDGLPQSGTGQTTLFTGINASKEIGKHFGPFPHSGIKGFLREQSVFHGALEMGKQPHFINAYPPIFFEKAEERNRWSCTTLMTMSSGISLNTEDDIRSGKGITADIIQQGWNTFLSLDVPVITPETAADRLLEKAKEHDLVLFEYYLTDKAGHSRDFDKADKVLDVLDKFLLQIIKGKSEEDTLVITSDHGNIEDLSVKTHTRNKVPLLVRGKHARKFEGVESLVDIKQSILNSLD